MERRIDLCRTIASAMVRHRLHVPAVLRWIAAEAHVSVAEAEARQPPVTYQDAREWLPRLSDGALQRLAAVAAEVEHLDARRQKLEAELLGARRELAGATPTTKAASARTRAVEDLARLRGDDLSARARWASIWGAV